MIGGRQGGVIRTVRARQLFGFRDRGGKAIPGKNGLDGDEGVAAGIARLNQRIAQSGKEPDFVVNGAGVGLESFGGAALRPTEEPPISRSNMPMASSVRRVMNSSAVTARIARRRSGDSVFRCCAESRIPSASGRADDRHKSFRGSLRRAPAIASVRGGRSAERERDARPIPAPDVSRPER